MWTFTAILGTAQCRPGNIVLATVYSSSEPLFANASIAGDSSVAAEGTRVAWASAGLPGLATLVAPGTLVMPISVSITGGASLIATVMEGHFVDAVLFATGIFFVNPALVLVVPFIKPTTVQTMPQPSVPVLPKAMVGAPPTNLSVGPAVSVPKTRTLGVSNKG